MEYGKLYLRVEDKFKLINYLNQFDEKLFITIKNKEGKVVEINHENGSTTGFYSNNSYNLSNIITENQIEIFYKSLFDKECKTRGVYTEKHFCDDQLDYLKNLSKDLKEEYKDILRPLVDRFNNIFTPNDPNIDNNSITVKAYALMIYYAKEDRFLVPSGEVQNFFTDKATEYGIPTAYDTLRKRYNEFNDKAGRNIGHTTRTDINNITNMRQAIELLKRNGYNKGVLLAEKELKEAEKQTI